MIGWPFSKSEDDDSDEENRHSASSEEDFDILPTDESGGFQSTQTTKAV